MSLSIRAHLLESLGRTFFPPLQNAPVQSGEHAKWEFAKAAGSYQGYADALGGLAGKRVLDFGCGWGGESAWLAERAEHVVGCDINDEALEHAQAFKQEMAIDNLEFVRCDDETVPIESESIDAVFSTNVFEHVMRPTEMLREIRRVLKPGGSFVSSFGPLFYSPLGYHLSWASQVPYAHLVFGLGPVIEVRNTRRDPIRPKTWEQTGLNRITVRRFKQAVQASGLEIDRLERIPVRGLHTLANLPVVGNLLTFGIDCHLRRPAAG